MASRSKRLQQQRERESPSRRAKAFIGIGIVLTVVVWVFWLSFPVDRDRERAMVYFKQVTDGLFQDKELPPNIHEWLLRIARDNSNLQLGVEFETDVNPERPQAIMAADLLGPKRRVVVYAPLFLKLSNTMSPDLFKSMILVAFLHEDIHNERWPLLKQETPEEVLDEEVRAYGKMCLLVIRPLREAGRTYPIEFARLDDLLRQCGDDSTCPDFHEAIRKYLTGQPLAPVTPSKIHDQHNFDLRR